MAPSEIELANKPETSEATAGDTPDDAPDSLATVADDEDGGAAMPGARREVERVVNVMGVVLAAADDDDAPGSDVANKVEAPPTAGDADDEAAVFRLTAGLLLLVLWAPRVEDEDGVVGVCWPGRSRR